jgi:hypothetical protein
LFSNTLMNVAVWTYNPTIIILIACTL